MTKLTTKSLDAIEEKMQGIDEGSMRHRILLSAKNFKTSWMDLGQALYAVWKDKIYKEWGYMTFDAFTQKEIGIRKNTALKLLKSYYFLEKEEPAYLQSEYKESCGPSSLPNYESVNMLRLAKDKPAVDRSDFARLKKEILENGKEPREVKKDLTSMMRQREELDPEEARIKKRSAAIRRLVSMLKAVKTEIELSKMMPATVLKSTDELIKRIEAELE